MTTMTQYPKWRSTIPKVVLNNSLMKWRLIENTKRISQKRRIDNPNSYKFHLTLWLRFPKTLFLTIAKFTNDNYFFLTTTNPTIPKQKREQNLTIVIRVENQSWMYKGMTLYITSLQRSSVFGCIWTRVPVLGRVEIEPLVPDSSSCLTSRPRTPHDVDD